MSIHFTVGCIRCNETLASRELLPSEMGLSPEALARALGPAFGIDYFAFKRKHSECGEEQIEMAICSITQIEKA